MKGGISDMDTKSLKTLGIIASIGGVAMTLLSGYVDDKKLDAKVDEAVEKKFAELKDDEENEEEES